MQARLAEELELQRLAPGNVAHNLENFLSDESHKKAEARMKKLAWKRKALTLVRT